MTKPPIFTACILIIGNEILSGRTADKNLSWLALQLNEVGVQLKEVRVIPDDEATIIAAVNESRTRFNYVFTTGGIGPTHDDITAASVARAFGVKLLRHPDAVARLEKHYGDQLNAARLKMAEIPEGGELIDNPVSAAPGFQLENVYVLAGVPVIMQAMFAAIRPTLKGGAKMLSRTLTAFTTEGVIAEALGKIQDEYPGVEIGSYPFIRNGRLGVSLVARSTEEKPLSAVCDRLAAMFEQRQAEWQEE